MWRVILICLFTLRTSHKSSRFFGIINRELLHVPIQGHGANSQLGPERPTADPSGQSFASKVHPCGSNILTGFFATKYPITSPKNRQISAMESIL